MSLKEFLGGDYTPIEHTVIALVVQWLVFAVCLWPLGFVGAISAGTAAGIAFFCGREHAQAESRLQDEYGLTVNQAAFMALRFWQWDRNSQMDMLVPGVVTLLVGVGALLV